MVIYDEFHLYSNKIESMIKNTIWIILWIASVYSIVKSFENNLEENASVIATSYFMFSLSLMMEFYDRIISPKVKTLSRLFHGLFAILLIATFIFSSIIMFTPIKNINILDALFYISITINAFLFLDILLCLFLKSVPESNTEYDDITKKIKEKSKTGLLGNINK